MAATKTIKPKKKKPIKISEKVFMKSLVAALRHKGVYVYRQNVIRGEFNGKFLSSGVPEGASDLVAIFPKHGLVVFIECKSSVGTLRDTQVRFRQDLEKIGGSYYVASPKIPLQDTLQELSRIVEDKCQKIAKSQMQESLYSKIDTKSLILPIK